jgi:phage-related protein
MSPHIFALDIAGAPHRWINVCIAAHYYATNMIAWAAGRIARILFSIAGSRMVILNGFINETRKTLDADLAQARKRLKEIEK